MRANAWHTVAGACALLLVALGITGCGPRPPEAELKAGARAACSGCRSRR